MAAWNIGHVPKHTIPMTEGPAVLSHLVRKAGIFFHLLVAWVRNAECSGVAPSVSLVKLVCLSIELWLHLAARGRARLEQDSYFNCRWA